MEWILVIGLYVSAVLVASYRYGSPGFIGSGVFLIALSAGLHYDISPNPLVAPAIAGFAAFMTTIMIPHWYLLATGREGIISRKRLPDKDL